MAARVPENLVITIVLKLASVLLRLENYYHVKKSTADELLCELHFLLGSAAQPISESVISDTFNSHNLQIDETVSESSPLHYVTQTLKAVGCGGLTSAFKWK